MVARWLQQIWTSCLHRTSIARRVRGTSYLFRLSVSFSFFFINPWRNSSLECSLTYIPPASISQNWIIIPMSQLKRGWESKFNRGRNWVLLERKKCGKMDSVCGIGINVYQLWKCIIPQDFEKIHIIAIVCIAYSFWVMILFITFFLNISLCP